MGRKACRDWRRKFVLRDFFVTSSPISKLANSFILSLNSKGRGRGSGGWCHSPHGRSWVFEFEYLWCKVCLRLAWTLTKCFIFVIYIFVTGCNGTETGQGRVKESQDRGPVRWIKEEEKSDAEVRLLYSSRCHWNQGKDSLWNQLVCYYLFHHLLYLWVGSSALDANYCLIKVQSLKCTFLEIIKCLNNSRYW